MFPGPGASDNPCDETFHGPSAASEPETQIVVDYVMGNTDPAWLVDVSMHTYGQYLLVPYGDCTMPPNWDTGLVNVHQMWNMYLYLCNICIYNICN